MKNLPVFLAFFLASLLGFSLPATADDLVATADRSSSLKEFVTSIERTGLDDTLRNSGPYTVFAPSDQAFARLSREQRQALRTDKDKLAQVLAYHVVPGKTLIVEVKPGKAETVAREPVTLTSDNGIVTINQASVIESDLLADNGVIHTIDRVLLPEAVQEEAPEKMAP